MIVLWHGYGLLEMDIAMTLQIMQTAFLMEENAVILMETPTTAKIVFAMQIWVVMVHSIWLEMASAIMKPIMQNAILMEATVADHALIQSNVLIVSVWMDPQ